MDSPIKVSKSRTRTAGAIRGKIRANVEANMMARMQAPIAYEGLYDLGYVAVRV